MSCYLQTESATALAQRRALSWRSLFNGAFVLMRQSLARRKHRQEFLDYIASDHRAAADIGLTNYNERELRE
jgi:hypothetical protein